MKAYHDNGKVYVELDVNTARKLREELESVVFSTEGYEEIRDLYQKLYYQTQN